MSPDCDVDLLGRVEDAGINASAPREQRWIDGWLVRFSPGKAKRARCIQPVAPGRLPVDAKLARCLPVFADAGLRPYVRITPFSQPEGLDGMLESSGMERLDDTRVMVSSLVRVPPLASPDLRFDPVDADRFAGWIGEQRGSTRTERDAHADRLHHAPVPYRALLATDDAGEVVAGGQVAVEGDLAGLYDVFTIESARGQGVARRLCRALLETAATFGARTGYLQVDAANAPALSVYRRLGFEDAYAYHYRTPAGAGPR